MKATLPYPNYLSSFIGKHKTELPSPSLCVSLPAVKANACVFRDLVKKSGISYRAHVKTNKTTEITRILLECTSTTKVAVSTLREARGLTSLVEEGFISEILYGVPIGPSMVPELDTLSTTVATRLIVDHPYHVDLLNSYRRCNQNVHKPWSVFIKIDMGARRAGLPLDSDALVDLIRLVQESPNIELFGFYAYASHACCTESIEEAEGHLTNQISGMLKVVELVKDKTKPLVLSVGSSPTARVIMPIEELIPLNVTFEIHAGSLVFNDLQQLATGTAPPPFQLAMTVMTEICSIYPHRNEALISAGVLALTREPHTKLLPGIARVRNANHSGWIVERVSQEHGVLAHCDDSDTRRVETDWKIGDVVELDIQHSCIVGAMFGWYFMTDESGTVQDIYFPWKWW